MKNEHPLVSVIIPAYKAERFIEETIRSVINQSYTNIECIVVDDGSTDSLASIVLKLIKEDDRITYIRQQNEGVSSARNHGFKISKGEYISFLDADDIWNSKRIERTMHALVNSEDNLGLVHTDMRFMTIDSVLMDQKNYGLSGKVLDDLLLWEQCVIPAPSSVLIKREVLNNIGLFNSELSTAADQEFFMRVTHRYQILRIPEELGFSRIYGTSMSRNNAHLLEKDHIKAFELAKQNHLFKSKLFERKCFSNLYLITAGTLWKIGNEKLKGIKYIIKAIICYPPIIIKLIKKI